MEPDRRCPRCGKIIPWGSEMPFLLGAPGLFLVAAARHLSGPCGRGSDPSVRHYGLYREALSRDGKAPGAALVQPGRAALKSGHAEAALADFRNALTYSRDNSLFQLRLAQALAATGRVQEARTYLLSLREREPGNGPVNLELARLAVREHADPEAVQYFHDAVYSEWEGDPVVQRRAVRLELVKFLLDTDQKAAARAELIGVAANLPPDAELHTQVGELFMNAGGYDDALRLFRQALAAKPHSAQALAGAGECYFLTGQYAQAEPYLEQALRQDPNLTQAAAMRDTARAVLDLDPFIRWLGEQERERRARRAVDQAMTRLEACAAQRGIDLQAKVATPFKRFTRRPPVSKPVCGNAPAVPIRIGSPTPWTWSSKLKSRRPRRVASRRAWTWRCC